MSLKLVHWMINAEMLTIVQSNKSIGQILQSDFRAPSIFLVSSYWHVYVFYDVCM